MKGTEYPQLNMEGWAIRDFELAMGGHVALNDAATFLLNQPRASYDFVYFPGARFIADVAEDYIHHLMSAVIERLERVRFDDPEDEERRINLWINYHTSFGSSAEPLSRLLSQVMAWRAEQ